MPQQDFLVQADQMNQQLIQFLADRQGVWGAYQSLKSEVSVQKTTAACTHLQWAYPRIEGDHIAFYIPGPKGFETGAWAQEPVLEGAKRVESLTGALIPGLGFDQRGRRLGRGKGYYDRYLSKNELVKVGVSLEAFVVKELPAEPHDIGMDYLITEKSARKIGT